MHINIDSNLDSYRQLHTKFGGQTFTPAPQYLLEFLAQRERLMQINALVDLYNLVSLKYGLALGAHDMAKVDGLVSFSVTTGQEVFYPLGATEPVPVS
nr:phenylalanine--tRNA ligase beta subunit-related protein [Clostridia bacterium]